MCVLGPYKSHAEVGSFSWTGKPKFSNFDYNWFIHRGYCLHATYVCLPTNYIAMNLDR